MPDLPGRERRLHPRVQLGGVVEVYHGNPAAKLGDYVIENISAGGTLLLGDVAPPLQADLELMLELPAFDTMLHLQAEVVRFQRAADGGRVIAVKFLSVTAPARMMLQQIVLEEIKRRSEPSVLLLGDRVRELCALAGEVRDVGRRVFLARTALQAVHWLSNARAPIDATLVSRDLADGSEGLDVLRFLRESYPTTRRILLAGAAAGLDSARYTASGSAHAVLRQPHTRAELQSVLRVA